MAEPEYTVDKAPTEYTVDKAPKPPAEGTAVAGHAFGTLLGIPGDLMRMVNPVLPSKIPENLLLPGSDETTKWFPQPAPPGSLPEALAEGFVHGSIIGSPALAAGPVVGATAMGIAGLGGAVTEGLEYENVFENPLMAELVGTAVGGGGPMAWTALRAMAHSPHLMQGIFGGGMLGHAADAWVRSHLGVPGELAGLAYPVWRGARALVGNVGHWLPPLTASAAGAYGTP